MALTQPWLKLFLEQALVNYLENSHLQLDKRSSRFAYQPEHSNLRISSPTPGTQTLMVSKLNRPSNVYRGIVSDGHHSIPFLSRDEKLQQWSKERQHDQEPSPLLRTTVDSIELRVSNCFDPPTVEAFVQSFIRIETVSDAQLEGLSAAQPISLASPIPELLRRYSEPTESAKSKRTMSQASSVSLKSQASPLRSRSDLAEADGNGTEGSSPISQARLATQLPLTDPKRERRHPLKELGHNVDRHPKLKSVAEDIVSEQNEATLHLLLNNLSSDRCKHHQNLSNSPNVQTVRSAQPAKTETQPSGAKVSSPTRPVRGTSPRRDFPRAEAERPSVSCHPGPENISLERTAATTNCSPEQGSLAPRRRFSVDGANKLKVESVEASGGVKDVNNMKMKLKRWRAEAVAGRYIPRRACRIPKQQLVILESDESWQPPLPGTDFRPGSVPLDLLNALTASADGAVYACGLKDVYGEEVVESEPLADEPRTKDRNVVKDWSALPSSQELPESQWSASPEREKPRNFLPPDSSLASASNDPNPTAAEDTFGYDKTRQDDEASLQFSPAPSGLEHDCPSPQALLPNSVNDDSEAPPSVVSIQETMAAASSKVAPAICCPEASQPVGRVLSTTDLHKPPPRRVQVKQTPYPGRSINTSTANVPSTGNGGSAKGAVNMAYLSHVPSTFVPSTFTEPPIRLASGGKRVFENLGPEGQTHISKISRTPPIKSLPLKRKHSGEELAVPVKQVKVDSGANAVADRIDPDYELLTKDKLAYRRRVLQALSKVPQRQGYKDSTSESSAVSCQPSNAASLPAAAEAKPSADAHPQVSTPLTIPSADVVSEHSKRRGLDAGSATTSSTKSIETPPQLFERYRTAYEDYNGSKNQFDCAISLLNKLQVLNKAPHPSLFDDFIYHRHHSYRLYYISMADSSERPVPYEEYYNDYIETPSHHAKVITVPTLRQLSDPRLRQDKVENTALTTANSRHGQEGNNSSVDVYSSISNIRAAPATAKFEENPEELHAPPGEDLVAQCGAQPAELIHPSQKSSVESWLEDTARAGSPELGTPEITRMEPRIIKEVPPRRQTTAGSSCPAVAQEQAAPVRKDSAKRKKRLSASPFVQSLESGSKSHKWYEEELTPFKRWAEQISSLPDERAACRGSSRALGFVDIFSWRR